MAISYIAAGYTNEGGSGADVEVKLDLADLIGNEAEAAQYAETVLESYAAAKNLAQEGDTERVILGRALWDLFTSYIQPVAQKYIRDQAVAAIDAQIPKLSSGARFEDVFADE